MVARSTKCDPRQLRRLLDDRLDDEEQAAMAGHLEGCASCRRDLEQLAAESRWWGDARLLAGAAPPPTDPESLGEDRGSLDFLEPPAAPGQLGKLGPYEVIEVIGRGGMGVVLKAIDRPLGRFVAIKVLAPELATSATARRRFAREAQAAAAISHEHIIAIFAVDATPGGLPFLVMPCVAGKSLQERLDRIGPLELREILRIGMQAASGLAAAHAVGLVHRDVKPANILLENCVERVKLTDFGLARAVDDASLTQSGVVAGTPQYMAPEQARGDPVDARADLFSLGSVLYALCTGRPPFRGETTLGVLRRVCEDTPRPIRELNPEIPDWFQAIVAKLQAKDPAGRFATAAEVADLLGRCLAYLERPDGQAPPFLPDRPPPPRRARPIVFGAAALVAAIAGLGASEVAGVSNLADYVATVLRIKTPDGTLVIKVDDPQVKVRVDGEEVVFSGAGPEEIRLSLRAGRHQVEKIKGDAVERELVTITRGGKETIRATLEAGHAAPPTPARGKIEDGQDTKVKRLEDRIGELERHLKVSELNRMIVKDRSRQLEDELKAARRRLAELSQSAKAEHAQIIESIKVRIKDLEGELARQPVHAPPATSALPAAPRGTAFRGWWSTKDQSTESPYRSALRIGSITLDNAVICVAVSPDGRMVAIGCHDGAIRLWDAVSWKLKDELKGHKAPVRSVAFSPDGTLLASAGGDSRNSPGPGELKLWHVGVDGFALGERDLEGHTALVWSVAFSTDGKTLATGSRDGTARLWDMATLETRAILEGHTDGVRFVAFRNAKMLATAGFDGDVKFWFNTPGQPNDGKLWRTYHASDHGLSGVAFSPDNRTLALSPRSASTEARPDEVVLFDLTTWKERARLKGHRQAILSLAFSPDGKTLATAGGTYEDPENSGEVFLWDAETGRNRARFVGLKYRVESLEFTPNGRALISGGGGRDSGGEVRFWDPMRLSASSPPARLYEFPGKRIWSLAYSPDGSTLALGCGVHAPGAPGFGDDRGALAVFHEGRARTPTFQDAPRYIRSVAYAPNGKLLATAELDGTAKLRDPDTGKVLRVFEDNPKGVNGVSFAPDGKTLATAGLDGAVRVWDLAWGDRIREFTGDGSPVYAVAFSPDGRTLASCGDDDMVHLRDPRTGASKAVLRGHRGDVESVAFSPDGRLLASTSWDRSAKLWDVDEGREVATLTGHTEPVLGAAFSPDGTLLATCGGTWGTLDIGPGRGELKLWDVATRSEHASLAEHDERIFAVAFSPDGKTLATAGWDGSVSFLGIEGRRPTIAPPRAP